MNSNYHTVKATEQQYKNIFLSFIKFSLQRTCFEIHVFIKYKYTVYMYIYSSVYKWENNTNLFRNGHSKSTLPPQPSTSSPVDIILSIMFKW